MEKIKYVYYHDDTFWVGWLEMFPDYRTQGTTLEELEENLRDIFDEIEGGKIPRVHKVGELAIK